MAHLRVFDVPSALRCVLKPPATLPGARPAREPGVSDDHKLHLLEVPHHADPDSVYIPFLIHGFLEGEDTAGPSVTQGPPDASL